MAVARSCRGGFQTLSAHPSGSLPSWADWQAKRAAFIRQLALTWGNL